MSDDDDFEVVSFGQPIAAGSTDDPYGAVKRTASILGDLRKELCKEGFTQEETFELIRLYWTSELGVIE